MKKYIKNFSIICLLFISFFTLRFAAVEPTLSTDYTGNIFRIGVIPWSDAKGWVQGAEQVMEGNPMRGVSIDRPLYPLFLVQLFSWFGLTYKNLIIVHLILTALGLTVAYLILQKVVDRLSVLLFLSLLAIWRVELSTVFLTGNLGLVLIVISFALIWRGIKRRSPSCMVTGYFFMGLSQAVRPWSLVCLVTVSFLPFFSKTTWKERTKWWAVFLLFLSLGYGLHPLSTHIFCEPGHKSSSFAKTLYGQVVGGAGWMVYLNDPVVVEKIRQGASEEEIGEIIFSRAYSAFFENPMNLVQGTIRGYLYYINNIPYSFVRGVGYEFAIPSLSFGKEMKRPLLFLIIFIGLVFIDNKGLPGNNPLTGDRRGSLLKCLPLFFVFLFLFPWFWVIFFIAGLYYAIRYREDEMDYFIILYLLGILLSIPFVGTDGGERVKISSDIFLYLVSSIGVARIFETQKVRGEVSASQQVREAFTPMTIGLPITAFLLLLAIPYAIRVSSVRHDQLPEISPKQVQDIFDLEEPPLNDDDIHSLWNLWPSPSFETVYAKLCFLKYDFKMRDLVYFKSGKGIQDPRRTGQLWPLAPVDMDRAILVREFKWVVFRNVNPEKLERFDGKDIFIFGSLAPNQRRGIYDTGFLLLAKQIGFQGKSGELRWIGIDEL